MNSTAASWFSKGEKAEAADEMYATGQFWSQDAATWDENGNAITTTTSWTESSQPVKRVDTMYDTGHALGFFKKEASQWPKSPDSEPISAAASMVNTWSEAQWTTGVAKIQNADTMQDTDGFGEFKPQLQPTVGPEGWWHSDEPDSEEHERWELMSFKKTNYAAETVRTVVPPNFVHQSSFTDWPASPVHRQPGLAGQPISLNSLESVADLHSLDLHEILANAGFNQNLRPASSWASDVVTEQVVEGQGFIGKSKSETFGARRQLRLQQFNTDMPSIEEQSLQVDPHGSPILDNFFESTMANMGFASPLADSGVRHEFLESYTSSWSMTPASQASPIGPGRFHWNNQNSQQK